MPVFIKSIKELKDKGESAKIIIPLECVSLVNGMIYFDAIIKIQKDSLKLKADAFHIIDSSIIFINREKKFLAIIPKSEILQIERIIFVSKKNKTQIVWPFKKSD